MYEVTEKTLKDALKPFDIISIKNGSVGYITEVSVNTCQPTGHQIGYSITWLVGNENKSAWWDHEELTFHCNIFIKIAEDCCHNIGRNQGMVQKLFNSIER